MDFHLLEPSDSLAPRYWMYEVSGVLSHAVMAYLSGDPMTLTDVGLMREYLRQWITAPVWGRSPEIDKLRLDVSAIRDRHQLTKWLELAWAEGVDPL